jgi:hypothetical protein
MKSTLLTLALSALATPLWAIDYIVTRTDDPNPDVIALPGCTPAAPAPCTNPSTRNAARSISVSPTA